MSGVVSAGRLLLLALLGDEDAVRVVAELFVDTAANRATVEWPVSVSEHPCPCADDLPALFIDDEQPGDGQGGMNAN